MPRILLVTNDFPPNIGGIESYLRDFAATLDPSELVVFASCRGVKDGGRDGAGGYVEHDAALPYEVIRWPRRMMLPTPATAARMQEIIREHAIEVVWFGAAAPLGLLADAARRAGARTVVASTHGHEVGWSMVPGARQALRVIGKRCDVVTYIADYTRRRLERPFGPHPRWVHLPSGVDVEFFGRPRDKAECARYFGLDPELPIIVCVSRFVPRKGQDQLLRALPEIRRTHPGAQLLLVGRGRYEQTLRMLADSYAPDTVIVTARDQEEIAQALHAADVFAMPVRTRGGGLDVEGLGIVYLEAQAAGVPVVAGDSGGAPETVTPGSGIVVKGTRTNDIAAAIAEILSGDRVAWGKAGQDNVRENWTWERMGRRLYDVTR